MGMRCNTLYDNVLTLLLGLLIISAVRDFSEDARRIADVFLRLSEVLGSAATTAARSQGLSALQLQIISLLARRGTSEPISYFARRFMISTATVSDSIRVLEQNGLVTKTRQKGDSRTVHVAITEIGREAVTSSAIWVENLRNIVAGWDERRRAEVFPALLEIIDGPRIEGMVPVDRMCVACRYLAINCDVGESAAPHYCRILNIRMQTLDLRLDCPEFEPVAR